MSAASGSFSLPSHGRLFRYLGETDAMVELTELAARFFLKSAKESADIGQFVSTVSSTCGIRVNLPEVECLQAI
jgi:hypothetical protein